MYNIFKSDKRHRDSGQIGHMLNRINILRSLGITNLPAELLIKHTTSIQNKF